MCVKLYWAESEIKKWQKKIKLVLKVMTFTKRRTLSSILFSKCIGDAVDVDDKQLNESHRRETVTFAGRIAIGIAVLQKAIKLEYHLIGNVEETIQTGNRMKINLAK